MASPRYLFGAGAGDFAIAPPSRHGGFVVAAADVGNGTFWSARTGGVQYTDIQSINGGAITNLYTDKDGSIAPFYGPPGILEGWLDFGQGGRVYVAGVGGISAAVQSAAASAQAAQDAAATANRPADTAISSAIATAGSATQVAGDSRWQRQLNVVDAAQYGVKADGVTDDKAALDAALAAARIVILPTGSIAVSSKVIVPAGRTLLTRGATIVGLSATNDFLLRLQSNTSIVGGLNVTVAAGAGVRGVEVMGSGVAIDSLTVSAPAPGAGAGNGNACGLTITGGGGHSIGALTITNFDYAVKISGATGVRVAGVNITSYLRGIYISDSKVVRVDGGSLQTASPNAAVSPGHNAVLLDATSNDATRDVWLVNLSASDSGEHGFRMGGSFRMSRVWFTNCSATNTGGCGFKVLGDAAAFHEDISLTSCVVTDAGSVATNSAGFMLQYVRRVRVDSPVVRKFSKANSADEGFNIQGADSVVVNNPDVADTITAGFAVRPNLGNVTAVRLNGGRFGAATGACIAIDYTGTTFRRVSVEGYPTLEPSGTAFGIRVTNTSGGAVTGTVYLTWQSVSGGALQVDTASTLSGWMCDTRAPFQAGLAFKAGSTWSDPSTGLVYRKAGANWYSLGMLTTGAGTPEGAVTAPVGTIYLRTDGGAVTTFYVKETGTGNTGWVAK